MKFVLEKGDRVRLPFGERGVIVEIRELLWGFPYVVKITHSTGFNAKGSKADYKLEELEVDITDLQINTLKPIK